MFGSFLIIDYVSEIDCVVVVNIHICIKCVLFCICFRLLQISPFNGKMNALNEVNKLIASVSYYSHRHSSIEEEEWLTAERMAVSFLFHYC